MSELTSSKPKSQEGVALWLLKLFAGLAIVIVMGIHLIVNHVVAPGGLLDYNAVLQYYTHLIIPIMEVAFLIIVIVHSLLGVRSIVLDLNPTQKVLSLVNWALVLLGSIGILYGTWLVIVVVQAGKG